MSNFHFGVLASPGKHEELKREINQWQYEIEGDNFKGKTMPYISELRFYEVRIPEQVEEQFVKDMPLSFPYHRLGVTKSWKMKLFFNMYRWFVKYLTPYEYIEEPKHLERKYKFSFDWYYILPLGKLKRKPIKSKITGKERDIM